MKAVLTKARIEKEAARLIRERGYLAASLRVLARRVGIKQGSLYYHYSSKQKILSSILNSTMDELLSGIESEIARGSGSPSEMLRNAIRYSALYHMQHCNKVYVTDIELKNLKAVKPLIAKRDRFEKFYVDLLKQGMETGELKCRDAKIAAFGILTMCSSVSLWYKDNGRLRAEDIAETFADMILDGLSA